MWELREDIMRYYELDGEDCAKKDFDVCICKDGGCLVHCPIHIDMIPN